MEMRTCGRSGMTGPARAFAMLFVALHILALFAFTLRWLWVAILALVLLIHAARAHEWGTRPLCGDAYWPSAAPRWPTDNSKARSCHHC